MREIPEGYVPYWIDSRDKLWPRLKAGRRLIYVKKGRIWVHIWRMNGRKIKIKLQKWDGLCKGKVEKRDEEI